MGEAHSPDDNQNTHPSIPHRQPPSEGSPRAAALGNLAPPELISPISAGCNVVDAFFPGSARREAAHPGGPVSPVRCRGARPLGARPPLLSPAHILTCPAAATLPLLRGPAVLPRLRARKEQCWLGSGSAPTQPAQREPRGAPAGSYLGSGRAPSAGS